MQSAGGVLREMVEQREARFDHFPAVASHFPSDSPGDNMDLVFSAEQVLDDRSNFSGFFEDTGSFLVQFAQRAGNCVLVPA